MWRIYELTKTELFIWAAMIAADILFGIMTVAFVVHVLKEIFADRKNRNKRNEKK